MTSKKVAVVTGSNKGVGLAIVKELCEKFDGTVILTSRDEKRGKSAVEALNKLGYFPQYFQLDIDDESSIEKLQKHLQNSFGGLDVLVNNAAVMFHDSDSEPFGKKAEMTIQTNFFSTLKVSQLLFPILRPHGRVVNVSSSAGHLSRISGDDPSTMKLRKKLSSSNLSTTDLCDLLHEYVKAAQTGEHGILGWPNNDDCYVVSKVGLCALTRIQQREFNEDTRKIIVNSVHPGYVNTDMSRHKGTLSPEQGAMAPCWLALLRPFVQEPKGEFVWHDKQVIDWINGPTPAYV